MPEKNEVGRPRLFATPEDFENKLAEYRAYLIAENEPITATGMALFLGFASKQSLYDYAKYPDFTEIVTKARTYIEYGYEKNLHGSNATGSIFALKNMAGWSDKTEIDHTSSDHSMTPKETVTIADSVKVYMEMIK